MLIKGWFSRIIQAEHTNWEFLFSLKHYLHKHSLSHGYLSSLQYSNYVIFLSFYSN